MTVTNQNQEIDSLKITENADGTFEMDWDPQDPKWSWLNGLTSKEIQIIVEQAIKSFMEEQNQNDA